MSLRTIFLAIAVALGAVSFSGCDIANCLQNGVCGAPSPPPDKPGSFSYYNQEAFSQGLGNFCAISSDLNCFYEISNDFATPLKSANWTANYQIDDGYVNGSYSQAETTEGEVINDTSNLVYISSHGNSFGSQSLICLRDCAYGTYSTGGTTAVGTSDIPKPWSGTNWLIIDACSVVAPNVGWEGTFGANLHGILGYNNEVQGLGSFGHSTLTTMLTGFDSALDAWEKSAAANSASVPFISALIPSSNMSDVIEARGGPHFGYDRDTNPVYIHCCTPTTTHSAGRIPYTNIIYGLTPESMNENAWYQQYGGGNIASSVTHPTSNENVYRNQYATVTHYLGSGGLSVAMGATGAAKGFVESDAQSFATSWAQSNGGLPGDAILTYAGAEVYSPAAPASSNFPSPNVRQFVFLWRHANSGVTAGDKIQLSVDDDGFYNVECNDAPKPKCMRTNTWNPVTRVNTYVRVWRTISQPASSITRKSYALPRSMSSARSSGYALCASDIAASTSQAVPCDAYSDTANGLTEFVDPSSGQLSGATEPL